MPKPNTPSASTQSQDAGMPSGFGTLRRRSRPASPGSSMPRSAIARDREPPAARATGRQRREGRPAVREQQQRPGHEHEQADEGPVVEPRRPLAERSRQVGGVDRDRRERSTPTRARRRRAGRARAGARGAPASTSAPSAAQVAMREAEPEPCHAARRPRCRRAERDHDRDALSARPPRPRSMTAAGASRRRRRERLRRGQLAGPSAIAMRDPLRFRAAGAARRGSCRSRACRARPRRRPVPPTIAPRSTSESSNVPSASTKIAPSAKR